MTRFWSPRATTDASPTYTSRWRYVQPGLAAALIIAAALAYLLSGSFRGEVKEATTALGSGDVDAIRDYLHSYGVWAPVASIMLMILQALLAPVPGFLIVFANGLAYGAVWGGLLSLTGQTVAAIFCFTLARSLGRGPVEALLGKLGLASADRWFERYGANGVFITRMIPGIGFDAISYAAGLTSLGFVPFVAATVVGAAPQAFIYAYLGEAAPWLVYVLTGVSTVVLVGGVVLVLVRRRRQRSAELAIDEGAPATR
jgi:uncharacterized membrane protein YdjX (TVP38/TMEM64 family)